MRWQGGILFIIPACTVSVFFLFFSDPFLPGSQSLLDSLIASSFSYSSPFHSEGQGGQDAISV